MKEIEKRKRAILRRTTYSYYLILLGTLYEGTINNLERFYQQTDIDTYSNFSFSKLFSHKNKDGTIDFVKSRVLPLYSIFVITLDSKLTDDTTTADKMVSMIVI